MFIKCCFIFTILSILWSCEYQEQNNAIKNSHDVDTITVNIGYVKLAIPRHYLPDIRIPTLSNSKLDKGKGITIAMRLKDLDESFADSMQKVYVFMHMYEPRSNRSAQDAWNGVDLYSERIVEHDNQNDLYRVYSKAGHPTFWHYFESSPLADEGMQDNWVASCRATVGTDGSDLSKARCRVNHVYESIGSEIRFSASNISNREEITAAYTSWLQGLQLSD